MRKIKFRAWDKTHSKIITNITGLNWVNGKPKPVYENWDWYKTEFELMQYTGLYDDNGTEIYEGDIVEVQNTFETKTSYTSQVYFTCNGVLINGHPAHIKMGHKGYRQLSGFCDYEVGGMYHVKCEVIGNIYEKSDLLEGN